MTREDLIELLKQPNLWEQRKDSLYKDALQLKDGSMRFYANESTCFRGPPLFSVIYDVPAKDQQLFKQLGHALRDAIYARDSST